MGMFDRYLWLLFIAIATAFVASLRSWLSIRGARSGFVAYTLVNLPWVLEGYGMLVYPRPRDPFQLFGPAGGWVGLAIAASVVANWVALVWWLFWREGAERLAACPGARRLLRLPENPTIIKVLAVLCILGGIAGMAGFMLSNR